MEYTFVKRVPQNVKLNGVMIMAPRSETAVRLTERATLPRARALKKFDTFPPGQEATRIIPNPIVGVM